MCYVRSVQVGPPSLLRGKEAGELHEERGISSCGSLVSFPFRSSFTDSTAGVPRMAGESEAFVGWTFSLMQSDVVDYS